MSKNKNSHLYAQIKTLELNLSKQKKISKALLTRVKRNLKHQININDAFEHNFFLLEQIKETKKKLIHEAKNSQRFSYMAKHDSLTGMYNRNVFNDFLKVHVATAKENMETHALFFLDLDQFKVINDTSGHLAGDEMIKQIATILLGAKKPDETIARLGGDEFGMLKKNCSLNQAMKAAESLLSTIEKFHFSWDEKLFKVSASIGLVIINNNTISDIEAQKNADIACYAAKNAGRNRVHLYQEADDSLLKQNAELQWVPKLTKALENDLFCLFAQPIKPTDPKLDYVHYEILVRLKEDGKIILPGVFLPPAERYNLITKIDSWIITKSFEWLAKNIQYFHQKAHFSINLSGQSLGNKSMLKLITALLDKNLFNGNRVHFEVTETMAISNLQEANSFIGQIKNYGCGFSLDDFGSGLSSLSYLKNLEVDTLKVDGVFIRDILDDPIDEEMVSSINNIGHVMGMKTVAEYVENEKIANKLIEMGFDYLQGNIIGEPRPLSDLLESIKARANKQVQ